MADRTPSIPARLWLAIVCLFRVIFDGEFAREIVLLRERTGVPSGPLIEVGTTASGLLTGTPVVPTPPAAPTPEEAAAERQGAIPRHATPVSVAPVAPARPVAPTVTAPAGPTAQEGALHVLALLQREGRLLDFLEENLDGFPDAAVGAAARTVHAGCRKVLHQHLALHAVRSEPEGAPITVDPGFDARAIRLTGNVVGAPPFKGALRHHGWKAADVRLPEPPRGDAALLLAPAEVELS